MKLPVVSGNEVIKALMKIGYKQVRQKGSHVALQKIVENKTKTVIVPLHKELTKGTLRSIIRQAELTVEKFIELLEK